MVNVNFEIASMTYFRYFRKTTHLPFITRAFINSPVNYQYNRINLEDRVVPPFIGRRHIPKPQWTPVTVDSTKLCMYYVLFVYIHMIKFNLQTRHSKRLTAKVMSLCFLSQNILLYYIHSSCDDVR